QSPPAFVNAKPASTAIRRAGDPPVEKLADQLPGGESDASDWSVPIEPPSLPADEEPEAESLAARLASLGALGADPAAFVKRAPGEGPTVFGLHIDDLLRLAAERKASDLHLSEGLPPVIRVDGHLVKLEFAPLVSGSRRPWLRCSMSSTRSVTATS